MKSMSFKRFVEKRDEMLLKRDTSELRKFVNENKMLYGNDFVKKFNAATDKVVEITMHKMIVNCTNLPFDFRQKSADWLMDRGFDLEIN